MVHALVRWRFLGLLALALVASLDQASKAWVRAAAETSNLPRELLPVFRVVLVWNRGVSFGFFNRVQEWMPLFLILATSAVAIGLLIWLVRARERSVIFALGLVIGGALGNILDRARFGAVVDFLDFHLGRYHWPAFNLADSAIFMGVVILLLVGIVHPPKREG